jgi:branched-chain amino acid transport system permease protein
VLGGMGSQLGVAVAAAVMIGGFELFRGFEQYRMLVFGAAMVAIVIYRPRGLVSTRTPSVFLSERKDIPAAVVQDARTESPA